MTSIAEELATAGLPAEWQKRTVVRDGITEVTTGLTEPVSSDKELLIRYGYDPDEIEIVGTVNQWVKEQPDGSILRSYFFKHRPKSATYDLPALYAAARRKPLHQLVAATSGRTSVPVLADEQIGKVGSRGGTPELIDRMVEKREKLAKELKLRKPENIFLPDLNDLFEGFENTASQLFTNDLSLAQQMDMAATEILEFVRISAKFGHVTVAVVPSNHTAWRDGKNYLGRPGDDFGIFIHRQVEKVAKASGLDAEWLFPPMWDEALLVPLRDGKVQLGMAHGNQFRDGRAGDWWAKQLHGGQPVGACDILLTGHYHHFSLQPSGRNPYTSRQKWHVSCPTLDNGSDWFRQKAGEDSDPGMVLFDVTDDGFDLQSLTIL